ncbi:hypothetical protein [Pajaroellobacter abortibovis]|uniref:Uncharacterized protein n=1 Tax=Pajaroellobacter abortibovis TaxID=1882918 RepID=A0A1L6MY80_9BACT|nr:hypothetical protein [Pajaroellobacter abortibovis]APS00459.1 hypothetical protein BCY86_07050 [Pajaroellobacter abortibovis]
MFFPAQSQIHTFHPLRFILPLLHLLLLGAIVSVTHTVKAQGGREPQKTITLWQTLVFSKEEGTAPVIPPPSELFLLLKELDSILCEGLKELGFTPLASPATEEEIENIEELQKSNQPSAATLSSFDLASDAWLISPRVQIMGADRALLTLLVVSFDQKTWRAVSEEVTLSHLSVRSLYLLRQLIACTENDTPAYAASPPHFTTKLPTSLAPGRTALAVNGSLFGAYVARSLQGESQSIDHRITYPLMALGVGLGLGGSLLIAEEWDIGVGDAWYLSAGAWWGGISGLLLSPHKPTHAWGLGGSLIGLSLTTGVLAYFGRVDEGGATLTHSGAMLGTFLGGLGEYLYQGTTYPFPPTGAGYGAVIGLIIAGVLTQSIQTTPSQVLSMDIGSGVGWIAAAAAISPFLFDISTPENTRIFIGTTLGGMIAGGTLGWLAAGNVEKKADTSSSFNVLPMIDKTEGYTSISQENPTVYGVSVAGVF